MTRGPAFRRNWTLAVTGGVLLLLVIGLYVWWTRLPQMGADKRVFAAVDALFTAITARDGRLLDQSESRLRDLKESGALGDEVFDYLDRIIQKARAGQWRPAAERLYEFMFAQRREASTDG